MIPRLRTGCEKWLNFHRGAFRPPSGGGSLRRRPPAPSASRRFEPVKLLWLCDCVSEPERCEWACSRSASSVWRCARFPPLFSMSSRLFEQWAPFANAYWLALPVCVCVKKKNRRKRELQLRQTNFRVRRRIKRCAVCRGWRKLSSQWL